MRSRQDVSVDVDVMCVDKTMGSLLMGSLSACLEGPEAERKEQKKEESSFASFFSPVTNQL